MGCASSTEVITDPITGHQKTKKRLGGAYPGQRPNPPAAGAATVPPSGQHFVHYHGGGNALVLSDINQQQQQQPDYVNVTLPPGVSPGDTIHVKAPDGRLNAIVVPPGMDPGSTFTVEFANSPAQQQAPTIPSSGEPEKFDYYGVYDHTTSNTIINNNNNNNITSATTTPFATANPIPTANQNVNDGFVSGFAQHQPSSSSYPPPPSYGRY